MTRSALALIFAATPAFAQSEEYGGSWELGGFSGLMDDRPDFEPEGGVFRLAHEGIFGLRAAHALPSSFFLEAELSYAPMELVFNDADGRQRHSLRALFFTAASGYTTDLARRLQAFARAGIGAVRWRARSTSEVDFSFELGGGFRYFIAGGLALRTDARVHMAPSALATTRRDLLPDLNSAGEVLWLSSLSAGLSIFLGR